MKRLLPLLLCLLLLWGCGSKDSSATFVYKKAPELYEVDLTQYDPSNKDVRFRIDDEGYLMSYMYNMGDHEILVNYSYQGRNITIFAFDGSEIIDTQIFVAASDFDKDLPMIEYRGYYIRGYKMPS